MVVVVVMFVMAKEKGCDGEIASCGGWAAGIGGWEGYDEGSRTWKARYGEREGAVGDGDEGEGPANRLKRPRGR